MTPGTSTRVAVIGGSRTAAYATVADRLYLKTDRTPVCSRFIQEIVLRSEDRQKLLRSAPWPEWVRNMEADRGWPKVSTQTLSRMKLGSAIATALGCDVETDDIVEVDFDKLVMGQ